VLSWNIGYADLESDNRAQNKDLPHIAEIILKEDPDVVALQELTGTVQLQILLRHLRGKYFGEVAARGDSDRTVGVLVKHRATEFTVITSSTGRNALAARFYQGEDKPPVTIISVHADTFNSRKRRIFIGEVVDWAQPRLDTDRVFLAGDFNLEVTAAKPEDLYTDNAKNDSEAYNYLLKHFRDLGGREAGVTAVNNRRIDYVFGPPVDLAGVQEARVIHEAAMGKMDHRPLLIDLTLH
jgi:endonuclease/exonuclease/phosphatase family metal-dependent hydrolase